MLAALPTELHRALLSEVLAPDLEFRLKLGEQAVAGDYDRFRNKLGDQWSNTLQALTEVEKQHREKRLVVPGYTVKKELGRGGMGVVYEAQQLSLNRTVALKVIRSGAHADDGYRSRFCTEAQSIARLRHPNIIEVFDCGGANGLLYLALEFCPGGTLEARVGNRPLPPRDAAELVRSLARAVHHAHQQGIVHRDLKPANVLFSQNREPKVADFGLAKRLDSEGGLTQSGTVVGTPSYMAPEQARGDKAVTPAADIYGLGAILYRVLTGRPPFVGDSRESILKQVRTEEPATPRSVNADLVTICLKCLEKDPSDRYRDAEAVADDLRRWLEGEPIAARPPSAAEKCWKWCRRNPTRAALLVVTSLAASLLLLSGYLTWAASQAEGIAAAEKEARQQAERLETAEKEARQKAEQLAEGQRYTALLNGVRHDVARRQLGWTWKALQDLHTAALIDTPFRDMTEIRTGALACFAGVDVKPERVLLSGISAGAIQFSPDGRTLAIVHYGVPYGGTGTVQLHDIKVGAPTKLSFPPETAYKRGILQTKDSARSVAFAPSGRSLVVGTSSGCLHYFDLSHGNPLRHSWKGNLKEMDLEGKIREDRDQPTIEQLFITSDGKAVLSCSYSGVIRRWDLQELDSRKPNKLPLAEYQAGPWRYSLALSPDGTSLICCGGDNPGLQFLETGTLQPRRPSYPLDFHSACFSSDGRRIAVASKDAILLLDVASNTARRFTDPRLGLAHLDSVEQLQFNPDASLLLSVSEMRAECKLWDTASGSLVATLTYPGPGLPLRACFSPSEPILVVAANTQVQLYSIGGLNVQTLLASHPEPIWDFVFSTGGESFATLSGPVSLDRTQGQVRLWGGVDTTHQLRQGSYPLELGIGNRCSLALSPNGNNVMCGHRWGGKGIGGAQLLERPFNFNEMGLTPIVASRDGTMLWGVAGDTIQAWNWHTGNLVSKWTNSATVTKDILSLDVGVTWVVAGCRNGASRILRVGPGTLEEQTRIELPDPVSSVVLSRDEQFAVSGTRDGVVRVVRVPDGAKVAEWTDRHNRVNSLAISPDDSLLAVGFEDGTVRLYSRREAFRHLLTLPAATGPILKVRFHPDGKRLVTAVSQECALRIWHLDRLRGRFNALGIGDPAL